MDTPNFSLSSESIDPYRNMKFRIQWNGRYVASFYKISGLKRSTEPVEHRGGGETSASRVFPGVAKFSPISLERGITHDPEFERWVNQIYNTECNESESLKNFREDVIIELLNEQGKVAVAYKLYRCWVSEFMASLELDAKSNAVAIERIVLQNEGFERDVNV